MRIIIILAFGLFFIGSVQAQVGSSISADGSAPNENAMLDVKSPSTGAGKGMLIPRVTLDQRTNANASVDGGLLDNSGNLRGGAAQGLIVYQTNGVQGLYFNASSTAAPNWVHLGEGSDLDMQGKVITNAVYYGNGRGITNLSAGAYTETDPQWATASNAMAADIATRLASNVWAAAGSTTNYLPRTGGTMSGALNMGAQIVTNVAHIDFNGIDVSVGRGANGSSSGAAVGYLANGSDNGAAVGYLANGSIYGAAVGRLANGYNYGAAMGYLANGYFDGAAMGDSADGSTFGVAMGYAANGTNYGAALGREAKGSGGGAAVGYQATGTFSGAAVGWLANGSGGGAGIGYLANGSSSGAALGREANGTDFGVALGRLANGSKTNVAIGALANAQGGTQQIAIGNNVTNNLPNTARIRGHVYMDGGTGLFWRATFGEGNWAAKAFEIDHPLDPENKVLRHFCLEGPQVWNVYAGNAQLVNGQAQVQLPDYYSALNLAGSEIYSLTVVGALAQIAVGEEVNENQFTIIGDKDVKVSWTIKVLRNDPGCLDDLRRRPVEQLKIYQAEGMSELQSGQAEGK